MNKYPHENSLAFIESDWRLRDGHRMKIFIYNILLSLKLVPLAWKVKAVQCNLSVRPTTLCFSPCLNVYW